jgi:serine/threonine-protein kinase
LLGTEGAYAPFFKPDGLWVAFFAGGKLKKISVEGGTAAELCNASGGRGGSWGEDGYIVATLGNVVASLSRIPDSGGNPEPFTEFQHGEISHRWPQVLPGGKAVLFTASSSSTSYYEANIEVVSLGDHHRKTLQKGGTYGRYVATSNAAGYLVYLNHATLYAVSFDPDLLETRGTPMPVLNEVGYTASNGTAQFDFSRTGTLVYRGGGGTGGGLFNVQWLDPAGNTQPLLPKPGAYQNLSVSPVGNRLAIEFTGKIAVYDWQNEQTTPLSFDGGDPTYPLWSPDGKYIVFQAPGGMFWTRADGASKPQQLTQSKNLQFPSSFTLDGKRLAFIESSPDNLYDIWTVPVEIDGAGMRADGNAEPFLQTPAYEVYPSFSPDGKWLAYFSNDGGTSHIYVKAFPDNRERLLISSAGGMHPVWSRKEKKLFFRTDGNQIMVADYVVEGDKFVAHKAHIWSEKRLANIGLAMNFDLAPDGRVAAFMPVEQPGEQKAENHVTFMLNFFDEMRRRLGSK